MIYNLDKAYDKMIRLMFLKINFSKCKNRFFSIYSVDIDSISICCRSATSQHTYLLGRQFLMVNGTSLMKTLILYIEIYNSKNVYK